MTTYSTGYFIPSAHLGSFREYSYQTLRYYFQLSTNEILPLYQIVSLDCGLPFTITYLHYYLLSIHNF